MNQSSSKSHFNVNKFYLLEALNFDNSHNLESSEEHFEHIYYNLDCQNTLAFNHHEYNQKWHALSASFGEYVGRLNLPSRQEYSYMDAFAQGVYQLHTLDLLTLVLPFEKDEATLAQEESKLDLLTIERVNEQEGRDTSSTNNVGIDATEFLEQLTLVHKMRSEIAMMESLSTSSLFAWNRVNKEEDEAILVLMHCFKPKNYIPQFTVISDTDTVDVNYATKNMQCIVKYRDLEFHYNEYVDEYKKAVITFGKRVYVIKAISKDCANKALQKLNQRFNEGVSDNMLLTDTELDVKMIADMEHKYHNLAHSYHILHLPDSIFQSYELDIAVEENKQN